MVGSGRSAASGKSATNAMAAMPETRQQRSQHAQASPEERSGDDGEENGGDAEDDLVVGEQKAERRADGDQPAARWALDVAHDGDEEEERADHGEDVMADVATLVEERRRDEEEGGCCQRAPAPQMSLAAQEDRQSHQDHPEERGAKRLEASEAPKRA